MKVLETVFELNSYLAPVRAAGKSVGLVPTMGYLHEGHLSLVAAARRENDIVLLSIFVNPTQFVPGEDFDSYPRDLARDTALADEAGVDAIFAPIPEDIYPPGFATLVEVAGEETIGLCAASRPGHFGGVTTVVAVLMNLIRPGRAYFGQKDAQQLAVIRRMVQDLAIDCEIIGCPIVREPDGLALSSRNVYLTPAERTAAPVLYQSLLEARGAVEQGERSRAKIIEMVKTQIAAEPLAALEYADVRGLPGLTTSDVLAGAILIAAAVKFGRARLIDNIIVEVNSEE
jgi:pantoate--beta-alanine ligase